MHGGKAARQVQTVERLYPHAGERHRHEELCEPSVDRSVNEEVVGHVGMRHKGFGTFEDEPASTLGSPDHGVLLPFAPRGSLRHQVADAS
jgi:hypothetical protein